MLDFDNLVVEFGKDVKKNLEGNEGEPEAQLTTPVSHFLKGFGDLHNLSVTLVRETSITVAGGGNKKSGTVRPDFGVKVNGLLVGHVELKAPSKSIDPATFTNKSHEYKQWQKLKNLPNLLYTNGREWRLYRYGELVPVTTSGHESEIAYIHTSDFVKHKGPFTATPSLQGILQSFLFWEPNPITSADKLVKTLAPLAVLLREEILLGLTAQKKVHEAAKKRAKDQGYDEPVPPSLIGLRTDWRETLSPGATDEEFADSFAQTVVFALVVAISEGLELDINTLHYMANRLKSNHGLLGNALNLLTDHLDEDSALHNVLAIIVRVLSVTSWKHISGGKADVYLHLYEHFLSIYDPEQRKKTGSYYTPVEVVDQMVRLTDQALRQYLNKPHGFADKGVSVIDPAMGTGTYPLAVLRAVAHDENLDPGDRSDALTRLAKNLYGFELQSGPFSVAELRISETLRGLGGELPEEGLNLYVTNTLGNPTARNRPMTGNTLRLLADQSNRANRVKREVPIQVCIGNPPYKDKAEGKGGWIEDGGLSGKPLLDDFRAAGMGKYEYVLKNLYVYFWRWAFWKVFENSRRDFEDTLNRAGVICFITADGYLGGPGFSGMREYIRRKSSRGWIINVTPEGKRPLQKNAVFAIETPVTIALFVREPDTDENTPAGLKYIALHGTFQQKMEALAKLDLRSPEFADVRSGWSDKFMPITVGDWDSYPELPDFYASRFPGVKPNKTWVYAPSESVLQERWHELVEGNDLDIRAERFKETRDTGITVGKKPLPGHDTYQGSQESLNEQIIRDPFPTVPDIVSVGYRSFGRQYLIADSRMIHMPSPRLWEHRVPDQVFIVEQHAHYPKAGPGLYFSALIPDMHAFNNRGGRVHPALNTASKPNLTDEAERLLTENFGEHAPAELVYYLAGVTGHPGYVRTFDTELQQAGIRVPLTSDAELWSRAVQLGKYVVWLHTYSERGEPLPGMTRVTDKPTDGLYSMPVYEKSMGGAMPEKKPTFTLGEDDIHGEIAFGASRWSNIKKVVFDYTVGGQQTIGLWAKYRLKKPIVKRSSSLNDIVQQSWPSEWTTEFKELLCVLTHLVHLEPAQEKLLADILAGDLIPREEFISEG
ncbi:type ISP restriction/modification enzyme [Rothia aeria]|uniref:type ISP restriction/modification enzyme n=1 Tax=Rothia aeria TaxID=172042 RepID=UPI0028800666|nr:type ISP restriction/modification enzyme [Rothia aeria]